MKRAGVTAARCNSPNRAAAAAAKPGDAADRASAGPRAASTVARTIRSRATRPSGRAPTPARAAISRTSRLKVSTSAPKTTPPAASSRR